MRLGANRSAFSIFCTKLLKCMQCAEKSRECVVLDKKIPKKRLFLRNYGGNMWESNPPGQFFATLTGFEDRGAHQHPSTPMSAPIIAWALRNCKCCFLRNF